ncbi:12512_t:CDS:2, partial [Ambispora gerdemannii]
NWMGAGSDNSNNVRTRHRYQKRNRNENPDWTFMSEWKYSSQYPKPRLSVSTSDKSFFIDGFTSIEQEKRVKIKFQTLAEKFCGIIVDSSREKNGYIVIYLSLKHPPELMRISSSSSQSFLNLHQLWSEFNEDDWVRTQDWTGSTNVFGQCFVYRLVFINEIQKIKSLLTGLAESGITDNPVPRYPVRYTESRLHSTEQLEKTVFKKLPFVINFKLACLLSHNALSPREVIEYALGDRLKELVDRGDERLAWHGLNNLLNRHWDPADPLNNERPIMAFEVAISNFKGDFYEWYPNPKITKSNKRYAWINHATVTPTKIYFEGPIFETSNRILRKYVDYTDRFMRVTFTEENFERLFSGPDNSLEDIYNFRIKEILKKGFQVARRHYDFLAFSSSGLREQSCWFVSSKDDFTPDNIRAWMGDFSDIRIPALYAARMGQAFTSTVGTTELDEDQVRKIPDVIRNGYTFSDGCGTISPDLAKRAIKAYWGARTVKESEVPSVYQIRFGGCKGVVSVDPTLEGEILCIRKSQEKFDSLRSKNLEIAKAVRNPIPAYLNRQIILLLSDLGINNSTFIGLQQQHQDLIESMMWDPVKAREVVQRNTNESTHISRTMLGMINAGLIEVNEPFLKGLLEVKRCFALKNLRHRARISVPNTFLLFGVMDETGILEANEVFVHTSTILNNDQTSFDTEEDSEDSEDSQKTKRKNHVWVGEVLVTRNPCLHPGDLSVLYAVDIPQLHHLKNCIVFSQKGQRPAANTMSGGDLDGDEFFVSSYKQIIPSRTFEPMSFDKVPRVELNRPVMIEDVCDFFADFMVNDRLGTICNLHMAFADFNEDGAYSQQCLMLAELASKAVDFNKTGDEYPDFLENKHRFSYESIKILGILYRRIKVNIPEKDPLLNYKDYDIKVDMTFLAEGYEEYIDEAISMRDDYNWRLKCLMKKYSIKTEPEIVTSNIIQYRGVDGKKIHDVRETISMEVAVIVQRTRLSFRKGLDDDENTKYEGTDDLAFNSRVPIKITYESKAKASAWYYVTYNRHTHESLSGNGQIWHEEEIFLSFAWTVADILLAARKDNITSRVQDTSWL